MGKGTDKLFITHSEWAGADSHSASGGKDVKSTSSNRLLASESSLPFWTCCISQQPVDEECGFCDQSGYVFDIKNIMPYIIKTSKNPVTSQPLARTDLIKLNLLKNEAGNYIDPVTYKEFLTQSNAVVLRPSGRVYFKSTINDMCIKQGNWHDLISDESFKRIDIITLKGGTGVRAGGVPGAKGGASGVVNGVVPVIRPGGVPSGALSISNTTSSPSTPSSTTVTSSSLSTHHMASSVTSTAVQPQTQTIYSHIPLDRLLRPKRFEEPGYASIETDLGTLNVELWVKYSPKAVYNFVQLAQSGYYDGIVFHRNIKNFMIQTGDPTGTGQGGSSAFPGGKPFADETNSPYHHDQRGLLSMANKGKNTNTSQFFITYKNVPHLDGKHTIFGKVVGGLKVLDQLENLPVGPGDKPKSKITMKKVKIIIDPFDESHENGVNKDDANTEQIDDSPWLVKDSDFKIQPVGKYLKTKQAAQIEKTDSTSTKQALEADSFNEDEISRVKRRRTNITNSDFSGW